MSRTDKTRPYWVQLRDPEFRYPLHESHSCDKPTWQRYYRQNGCDLKFPLPPTRRGMWRGCEIWCRYRDYDKVFGRRPIGKKRKGWGKDGAARAHLRKLRHGWLTTAPEDYDTIDSFERAPTQRQLWRCWYWD